MKGIFLFFFQHELPNDRNPVHRDAREVRAFGHLIGGDRKRVIAGFERAVRECYNRMAEHIEHVRRNIRADVRREVQRGCAAAFMHRIGNHLDAGDRLQVPSYRHLKSLPAARRIDADRRRIAIATSSKRLQRTGFERRIVEVRRRNDRRIRQQFRQRTKLRDLNERLTRRGTIRGVRRIVLQCNMQPIVCLRIGNERPSWPEVNVLWVPEKIAIVMNKGKSTA